MENQEIVYFVHISDSHIGPSYDYSRHGHNPYQCATALVKHINQLPVQPDFVMHTGDIVTHPDADAYRLAAEIFSQLESPIYYATGNHDRAQDIHRFLPMGPKKMLSQNMDVLSYAYEIKGFRFLILDARGPDEIDPHGILTDEMLGILESETAVSGPPLTIFTHFPIHPLNSTWMDAYMLIINGQRMHQMLTKARERIRGVFYGHVHQSMQTMRDGVLYVAVASTFSQFTAWPGHSTTGFDPDYPPAFNFIHLLPEQTIIHQHIIPRPSSE